MRLLFNGRASSKRTRHLDIKIFHTKDVIKRGDLSVEYCPTEEMWADVLTKPLQGKNYRVMRSKLMNCEEDYVDPIIKSVTFAEIAGVPVAKTPSNNTGVPMKIPVPVSNPVSRTPRHRKPNKQRSSTSGCRSVLGITKSVRANRARTDKRLGTQTRVSRTVSSGT